MDKLNKSHLMTIAWFYHKKKFFSTFSEALQQAWKELKSKAALRQAERKNGKVDVSELVVGDTLKIEYGDYDNWVTCTITGISHREISGHGFFVFTGTPIGSSLKNVEFTINDGEMVLKQQNTKHIKAA
jgi:hypothetical protein